MFKIKIRKKLNKFEKHIKIITQYEIKKTS